MPISKYNVQLHTSTHFLETKWSLSFLFILSANSVYFWFCFFSSLSSTLVQTPKPLSKVTSPLDDNHIPYLLHQGKPWGWRKKKHKINGNPTVGWYHFNRMDLSAPSVAVNDSSSGVLGQITFNELAFEESILLGLFISFPFFRDFQGQQL